MLALQERSNRLNNEDREIPFVIMTSGQTHEQTLKLLEDNKSLIVFDAYRPQRAVDDFVSWVHDEDEKCGVGDQVKVISTRPLSKLKRWRVLEVVKKAQ